MRFCVVPQFVQMNCVEQPGNATTPERYDNRIERPRSNGGTGQMATSNDEKNAKVTHGITITEQAAGIIRVIDLIFDETQKPNAYRELVCLKEEFPDIAILLWFTPGVMVTLIHEITSTYSKLYTASMSAEACHRLCNCLSLLQCLAVHESTRLPFLRAQIPAFLEPFLNCSLQYKNIEYIKLACLGILGALIRGHDNLIIDEVLRAGVFPLALQVLANGCALSKTVAAFFLHRILSTTEGIEYIYSSSERLKNTVLLFCQVTEEIISQLPQDGTETTTAQSPSLGANSPAQNCTPTGLSPAIGFSINDPMSMDLSAMHAAASGNQRLLKHLLKSLLTMSEFTRGNVKMVGFLSAGFCRELEMIPPPLNVLSNSLKANIAKSSASQPDTNELGLRY